MKKITLFLTMLLLVCVSTAVAQENGKMYKLKVAGTSNYLTAFNNSKHETGSVGGVGVSASTTNENAQIFTFASARDSQGNPGFTLKSEEGRFIKCWKWNIDAINNTESSVLIFESAGNNQFRIKWFNNVDEGYGAHNAIKYIKVQKNNHAIVNYLNKRDDISYKEMEDVLLELGFKVDSKGYITWD